MFPLYIIIQGLVVVQACDQSAMQKCMSKLDADTLQNFMASIMGGMGGGGTGT